VTPARFLESRAPAWNRIEQLIEGTRRRGVSALSGDELHELTRLYPAVAVDVARARLYKIDPATQRRINRLAIAAHGLLYRRPRGRPLEVSGRFFTQGYPQLFRRLWPYVLLASAIFGIVGLGTYVTVLLRPSAAYIFVPAGLDVPDIEAGVTEQDISERFRRLPNPPLAAGVMTNNISLALKAFALGITACLGTGYILLVNGMMLGAFVGHFVNYGLGYELLCFLFPHGFLEIFAILVAAAAGLRLGMSLAVPGDLTRRASLRRGAREAVLLVLGTIPMFVVAGVIEGFVTPAHWPGGFKILIGSLAGGTTIIYLLLAGQGANE